MNPAGRDDARRGRRWGWVVLVAWAALLFWQSSSSGAGGLYRFLPAGSDKVAHALAYLVLGGAASVALGSRPGGALVAVLFGISDEIHQSFVPGRTPDLWDLVADAVGALLGAYLAPLLVWYPWRRNRDPHVE